jgi:DNA-binding NtrC family response regulator
MHNAIHSLRDKQGLAKLVGSAPAFLDAISRIPLIAHSEATVLVTGETGTGKELIARAIHYISKRAPFPFVALNCGSLSDNLIEEELFGHEKGAFTDAHARRRGLIAQSDGGTLFLDEVGSLSHKGQGDLLRVLENRTVRAVGSNMEESVNLRVVAATNIPIEQLVRSGTFRADLYYRLSVLPINLPPLRQRTEDILELATYFMEKHSTNENKLSEGARTALVAWKWPGNVRELENAIIRGIHLSRTALIEAEDLGLPNTVEALAHFDLSDIGTKLRTFREMKLETILKFEKAYLKRLISDHRGNVSEAARASGKERRDLSRLLKKHRLNAALFRNTRMFEPEDSP